MSYFALVSLKFYIEEDEFDRFGQAMAFHLSMWYTKRDLAKRVGFFISGGALAGAFSGLLSYGVSSIHHPKIEAWKVLFLIEG